MATKEKTEGFQERTYRNLVRGDDLVGFEVVVKETDLLVRADERSVDGNQRVDPEIPASDRDLYREGSGI